MADITSRRQQTKIAFALPFQLNEPGYILCQNTKDSLLKKLIAELENMLLGLFGKRLPLPQCTTFPNVPSAASGELDKPDCLHISLGQIFF
jgi:hypothetical protein